MVRTLGGEDTRGTEMATLYSSILDWKIPWTEEPGGYRPQGQKESDMTQPLNNKNKQLKKYSYDSRYFSSADIVQPQSTILDMNQAC